MSNGIIRSLWIGDPLSTMERLSICSFLAHGHEYHLYTYGPIANVPAGAVIRDANRIVPASRIFTYSQGGSYAGFANRFRYQLLYEHGGWWVDTDVVALKPFDFDSEYVFSSETDSEYRRQIVTSGIIKAPAGSPAMRYARDVCREKDAADLVWGETGPRLVAEAVRRFDLDRSVQPYHTFCPTFWADLDAFIDPRSRFSDPSQLSSETYAIHLWHEVWRSHGCSKDAAYPEGCLYERLKLRYL